MAEPSVNDQIESLQKTLRILMIMVVVLVLAMAGLFARDYLPTRASAQTEQTADNKAANDDTAIFLKNYPQLSKNDHIRGNPKAKYILFEYSDLECPFCQRFHQTAQDFLKEYGADAAWVYRHFPLDNIHSSARPAAIAAECVAQLGGNEAFWQFVDAIFGDSEPVNLAKLSVYLAPTGIAFDQFDTCYQAQQTEERVTADVNSAINYGVTGTPGNFLVNTQTKKALFIPGALPLTELKKAVASTN